MRIVGELQSIHRARHIDVGEENANVFAFRKKPEGLIRVGGLIDFIPSVLESQGHDRPNEGLIFNDENGDGLAHEVHWEHA